MAGLLGYINLASNAGDTFTNALDSDLLIFTQSNCQSVLIGCTSNSAASLRITSNEAQFNANIVINNALAIQGLQIVANTGASMNVTQTAIFGYSNDNLGDILYIGGKSSSNYFKFLACNAEIARLTGAGFLGIGTSNPGSMLAIAGSTTIGAAYSNVVAPANGMIIQGNLGIGKSNPIATVDIAGTLNVSGVTTIASNILPLSNLVYDLGSSTMRFRSIYIASNTIDMEGIKIHADSVSGGLKITDSNNSNANLILNKIFIGTSSNAVTLALDTNNNIQFTNVTLSNGATITTSNSPVSGWSNNSSNVFMLGSNVGVGRSNPLYPLHVYGSNGTSNIDILAVHQNIAGASGIGPSISYNVTNSSGASWTEARIRSIDSGISYGGQLIFDTGVTGSATSNTTEKMRITSLGALGIGTSNPGGLLSVAGNATIGAAYSNVTAPTDGLLVKGNVGIGTSNPASYLAVAGNSTIGAAYSNVSAPTDGLLVKGNVGIGTSNPASYLAVAGNVTIGTAYSNVTAPTDGLLIKGNVGIGTSSPGALLDVNGNARTIGSLDTSNVNVGAAFGGYVSLYQGQNLIPGTNCPQYGMSCSNFQMYIGGYGNTTFMNGGNSNPVMITSANTIKMTVATSIGAAYSNTTAPTNGLIVQGNVGIGNTNPSYTLDVTGSIHASNQFVLGINGGHTSQGFNSTTIPSVNRFGYININDSTSNLYPTYTGLCLFNESSVVGNIWTPALSFGKASSGGNPNEPAFIVANIYNAYDTNWAGADICFFARSTAYNGTQSSVPLERMRVTGGGNVGIGTSNPGALLSVAGALSIGTAYSNTTVPTDGLLVKGNVGIGTSNPGSLLSVAGGASIGAAYSNVAAPTNGMIIQGNMGIGMSNPGYALSLNGINGSAIGPHIACYTNTDTNPLFQLMNYAHDNVALMFDSYYNGNFISSTANNNFQIYKTGGNLNFNYVHGAAVGSNIAFNNAMTISGTNGNVGISTGSPAYPLDVSGTIRLNNTSQSYNKLLVIYDQGVGESLTSGINFYGLGINSSTLRYQVPAGNIHAWYAGNTQSMIINGSGYVGIGTNSPTNPLTVSGNANIIGSFTKTVYNSGETIQTQLYGSSLGTSANTSTSGNYPVAILSITITPKSTNSYISVNFDASAVIGGNGPDSWSTGIVINGNTVMQKNYNYSTDVSSSGRIGTDLFPILGVYKNTGTSTLTITINTGRINSDDGIIISTWTCQVQEVQV